MPPAQGGVDGGGTGEGDMHVERSFVSAPVPRSDADAKLSVAVTPEERQPAHVTEDHVVHFILGSDVAGSVMPGA
ncbi:hypothetical protein E2562_012676 [Oryza meyeriana var. granulata]|uniref:Uncharacterized protein n=1 Tax=Oryza meyeriana var. granulata TaxID=110450 RepID=A0A6G1CGU1_9ORYZ|nr:hypothetical protein E2562_012676 [Oryza meyeriana var. granulata]